MRHSIRWAILALAAVLAFGTQAVVMPASGVSAAGQGGPCAWGFVMSPKNNVIWPETNAIFWSTPYILFPGSEMVLTGSYPEARYMSVKTYGFSTIVDSLNDQQIQPDEGSMNPFNDRDVPEDPDVRRYTVRIRPGIPAEEGDNELAAFENAASFGIGFLSYRVYVPDDPTSWTGGTLPDITIKMFGGRIEKRLPTCPQALPGPAAVPPTLPSFGSGAAGAAAAIDDVTPIVFKLNTAEHLFPNPDDAYLVGIAAQEQGQIAVVRAKGPLFPDTRAGAHVTDPQDVRYWSMCVHMLTPPLPTADCAGDFETVTGADGYYTYVVSLPDDRPANADAEHGITWLPWGRPGIDVALTLRNMLPDPAFANAIQNIVEPDTEAAVMGDYYPIGGLCDKALFEAEGPAACLPEG